MATKPFIFKNTKFLNIQYKHFIKPKDKFGNNWVDIILNCFPIGFCVKFEFDGFTTEKCSKGGTLSIL